MSDSCKIIISGPVTYLIFSHEHEKLCGQYGKYFFDILAVSYAMIKVFLVDNNLFKARNFSLSKKLLKLALMPCNNAVVLTRCF